MLYLLSRTQGAQNVTQNIVESGVDTMTATLSGWQNVQQGPYWVPIINTIENDYAIPNNLLARIAYQESRFRPEVIDGTKVSTAGALGLMQLMPQYFTTVQRPVPFSQQDTLDQIRQAAQLLIGLYRHFQDWGLAIAGYNDGQTNVDHYLTGERELPAETSTYVAQVLSDVPVASATFSA